MNVVNQAPWLAALALALACGSAEPAPAAPSAEPASTAAPSAEPEAPRESVEAASSERRAASQLLRRFTWGARPAEVERAAADLEALRRGLLEPAPPPAYEGLPADQSAGSLLRAFPPTPPREERMDAQGDQRDLLRHLERQFIVRAIEGEGNVVDLLTDFWFNHFNVFASKRRIRYALPDYEARIRELSLGSFGAMLRSVAAHPAMLEYLDNASSVRRRSGGRGLNENYARELLELHTLGEGTGYTQQDVRETARVFTGWNLRNVDGVPTFEFRARAHDRGEKTVLGVRYAAGMDGGERLLAQLASNEHTARRIGERLATRFLSDDPSDAVIARLARAYTESNGELRPVVLRLLARFEDDAETKFKTPLEYVVSAARLVGAHVRDADPIRQTLTRLRMAPYAQVVPTGYSPRGDDWLSTAGMVERFGFVERLLAGEAGLEPAESFGVPVGESVAAVLAWAEDHAGPLSAETREALTPLVGPGRRVERLRVLLSSPEFMQR
ncbi:MAG: DUF1800 domain-containing protein [Myxococcota bacterium]